MFDHATRSGLMTYRVILLVLCVLFIGMFARPSAAASEAPPCHNGMQTEQDNVSPAETIKTAAPYTHCDSPQHCCSPLALITSAPETTPPEQARPMTRPVAFAVVHRCGDVFRPPRPLSA